MTDPFFDLSHPEPHELLVEHRSHAFLPPSRPLFWPSDRFCNRLVAVTGYARIPVLA